MPVTARLSQRFYERFGDDLTNELVDWFNSVDATYRSDLKETNELNFARFDAKLDQRFAESDAKWEKRFAELDAKWEKRFAELDAKWEKRFAELVASLDVRFAAADTASARGFAEVDVKIERVRADLVKWMFVFWTGTILAQAGLLMAILGRR